MKKVLLFILVFITIMFVIPILFLNRKILSVGADEFVRPPLEELSIEQHDYSKYSTIKLLHKKTDEVEEVNLDVKSSSNGSKNIYYIQNN